MLIERKYQTYHSTPLRHQQIHSHVHHLNTTSGTSSSSTDKEQLNSPIDEKECRNTR